MIKSTHIAATLFLAVPIRSSCSIMSTSRHQAALLFLGTSMAQNPRSPKCKIPSSNSTPAALDRPPMLTMPRRAPGRPAADSRHDRPACRMPRRHGEGLGRRPRPRSLRAPIPGSPRSSHEAGGRLIGYALLVPMYRALEGQRGMELHQIFVRKDHRGHGIGRHLVSRAREHARIAGCGYLSVSAATGNFGAHRFYGADEFPRRPGDRYALRSVPGLIDSKRRTPTWRRDWRSC